MIELGRKENLVLEEKGDREEGFQSN